MAPEFGAVDYDIPERYAETARGAILSMRQRLRALSEGQRIGRTLLTTVCDQLALKLTSEQSFQRRSAHEPLENTLRRKLAEYNCSGGLVPQKYIP